MQDTRQVPVWDPLVRVFHWTTVTLCVLNFFILEEGETAHRYVGYTIGVLVVIRIIWGFVGTHYARFNQWWPRKGQVIGYLEQLRQRHHPYYLGHNPLGSLMVLFLLVGLAATVLSGWMTTWDAFWGEEWLEEVHEAAANTLMFAAGVHAAAVLLSDRLVGHGLLKAMWNGRKLLPDGVPVEDPK